MCVGQKQVFVTVQMWSGDARPSGAKRAFLWSSDCPGGCWLLAVGCWLWLWLNLDLKLECEN